MLVSETQAKTVSLAHEENVLPRQPAQMSSERLSSFETGRSETISPGVNGFPSVEKPRGSKTVFGGPYLVNEVTNGKPTGPIQSHGKSTPFNKTDLTTPQALNNKAQSATRMDDKSTMISGKARSLNTTGILESPTEYAVPQPPQREPPRPPIEGTDRTIRSPNSNLMIVHNRHRRAQSASSPGASPNFALPGHHLVPPTLDTRAAINRRSSPIPHGPVVPPSPSSSHPGLQHRHTLQVPAISSPTNNRDFSFSTATGTDDGVNRTVSPIIGSRRASFGINRRTTRSMHSEMHLEEIPQDADAVRWTEKVKQRQASRRRRKEEEQDDRVLVGTKVDQNHQNYVTAYNMLTGIRFTVSRTNAKIDRELTDQDFEAKHKYSFDVTGSELTPSAKYDFKFKDYAPWVFRRLRAKFGLDPADYLISLTSKYILSELGSPGKSGSFFYFSRDYKYIIKTIHHAEHKLMRRILKEYYQHIENEPNTLISQLYGLHRVKVPYGKKIHFVVMNNLFPPHRDVHQTYDLKGSTVGRELKDEDLQKNPRGTLKDLNWLRRNNHLEFGPILKHRFIEQVQRDVALLQRLHIMDYSLLVGIHDLSRGNEENLRDKTLKVYEPGGVGNAKEAAPQKLSRSPSKAEAKHLRQTLRTEKPVPMGQSTFQMPGESLADHRKGKIFYSDDGGIRATHDDGSPGDEIYYLGIIDCLTHYGLMKRLEHFIKGFSAPKNEISAVKPDLYGSRFIRFMSGTTMTREEAERRTINSPLGAAASPIMSAYPGGVSADSPSPNSNALPSISATAASPIHGTSDASARDSIERKQRHAIAGTPATHETEAQARTLTSVARDPPADPGTHVTLPVLEEVGESSSTGGYSAASREVSRHDSRGEGIAVAPVIMGDGVDTETDEVVKLAPYGGRPPPTPPSDATCVDGTDVSELLEKGAARFTRSPIPLNGVAR